MALQAVELSKAYRLLNHGPTVLVSSAHQGRQNCMAAAWSMPLDFSPPKVAVVIDSATLTRELVEASGCFALNVPSVALAEQTVQWGTHSGKNDRHKLQSIANWTFPATHIEAPLIRDCIAWLECRVLSTSDGVAKAHDLFLAEVVAAHADDRVFRDGHWHFDEAPESLRSLHYVAGGHFYAIGPSVQVRT